MNEPAIVKVDEVKKPDTLVQSLPSWDLTPPVIMIKKGGAKMTYYEYVMLIKENITSPRNETFINLLNNVEYGEPVITRLTQHVINMITDRLQNSFDTFIDGLLKPDFEINNMPILLAELKREIIYASSITKTTLLKDHAESLKSQIIILVDSFETIIKNSLSQIKITEIRTMLNNLNLKEGI